MLTDTFHVSLTTSVLQELTRENHYGSEVFLQYATGNKCRVIDIEQEQLFKRKACHWLNSLGQGELDTIKCFMGGGQDFIIIDDGRAARYCSKNSLPFINALLFPKLLNFGNIFSKDECYAGMDRLIGLGRYSVEVIGWARNCKKEALFFAIPDKCGV